jgi:hypothetical protein
MIAIHGPSNPSKPPPLGSLEITFPDPLIAEAETLGSALLAYSREYGVRFRPYDGSHPHIPFEPGEPPKYFFYEKSDGSSQLVDIHIERGREIICAKQDLSIRLQQGDAVRIGQLAC